jgi:Cu/Ag efflux pump CusA
MSRITAQAGRELQTIPGVDNVGAHVGRAVTGDAVVGINSAELWVSLDPTAAYDATLNAIHDVINSYPGLFREVQTYQPERTEEALMESNEDLVVRVYGYDLGVLRRLSQDVRQAISGISGVVDARTDIQIEEPQVEIEVDLSAAEYYQVKPGDVRRAAATLLSGLQVGNLYEEQKVFDVVVWGVPEIRNNLTDIRELMIDTPGGQVPLADLADVRIVPSPIIIKRDIVSRFIDVEADISGRNLGSVTADVKDRLEKVEFPLEYHAEVLSASGQKQATRQRIFGVVVASAIGIFLLMQATFRSFRLASVVFLTLPIALSGGVLAALLGGRILSLGSLFGFVTVFGIAVRNSVVLINHFHHFENHEGQSFGPKLILRGMQDRLVPIIMATLALGLALLPLAVFGNIAGGEIVQPMAIVILGGLITSVFFNLFIVPTLFLRFANEKH